VATTTKRTDHLDRNLVTPASNVQDHLNRITTSTADYLGRLLRRDVRANTTAVTLNQEIQFTTGENFIVTVAGTTAAAPPSVPAIGATVADGSATLLRQR